MCESFGSHPNVSISWYLNETLLDPSTHLVGIHFEYSQGERRGKSILHILQLTRGDHDMEVRCTAWNLKLGGPNHKDSLSTSLRLNVTCEWVRIGHFLSFLIVFTF